MKIILLKNVDNLGRMGDLVDAKPGYARNYLIPKGFAIEATPGNRKRWENKKAEIEQVRAEEAKEANVLKDKLEALVVELEGKAGEGGRLFGSITSQDIADGLKAQHEIEIDRRKIELADNIKTVGETVVDVRVYPEVVAQLKVNIKVD